MFNNRMSCFFRIQLSFVFAPQNTYIKISNLDELTYAGNMENLKEGEGDGRHLLFTMLLGTKSGIKVDW